VTRGDLNRPLAANQQSLDLLLPWPSKSSKFVHSGVHDLKCPSEVPFGRDLCEGLEPSHGPLQKPELAESQACWRKSELLSSRGQSWRFRRCARRRRRVIVD